MNNKEKLIEVKNYIGSLYDKLSNEELLSEKEEKILRYKVGEIMEIIEKVETVFSKIKKIFHWIPFLWKLDDGSYESLYKVNIEQMIDIQKEIGKFVDVYQEGFSYCLQMEEP